MTRVNAITDDLSRIGDIIVAARGLVAQGQIINIKPLEHEIARLCCEIGAASAIEAQRIKPVLLGLIDELDQLANEMRACQRGFEDQLRSLSSHGNAVRTYQNTPAPAARRK